MTILPYLAMAPALFLLLYLLGWEKFVKFMMISIFIIFPIMLLFAWGLSQLGAL
jgi:hypothetical protein